MVCTLPFSIRGIILCPNGFITIIRRRSTIMRLRVILYKIEAKAEYPDTAVIMDEIQKDLGFRAHSHRP